MDRLILDTDVLVAAVRGSSMVPEYRVLVISAAHRVIEARHILREIIDDTKSRPTVGTGP